MSKLPRPSSSLLVRAAPVFAAALAGMILVPVFLLRVSMRVESVRLGYALSDAASRIHGLRAEHQKLRLELETLRAPDRLAALATNELGLHPPTPGRFWRVAIDGRITVADVLPEPPPTAKGKRKPAKGKPPPAGAPALETDTGPKSADGASPAPAPDLPGEAKAAPGAAKPEASAPEPEGGAP